MTGLRYPRNTIRADFARSAAGLLLTGLPLASVSLTSPAGVVLGGLAVLFAGFGVRTWARQRLIVTVDDEGLVLSDVVTKNIPWKALSRLELRYYAVGRNRSRGWMQVTLEGSGVKVRLDSTLEGFPAIARRAAAAAEENGVALSQTTIENLRGFDATDRRP